MTNAGVRGLAIWCRRHGNATMLAGALGVRPQAVGKWKSGRALPTVDKREKIAVVTGIPADAWERR